MELSPHTPPAPLTHNSIKPHPCELSAVTTEQLQLRGPARLRAEKRQRKTSGSNEILQDARVPPTPQSPGSLNWTFQLLMKLNSELAGSLRHIRHKARGKRKFHREEQTHPMCLESHNVYKRQTWTALMQRQSLRQTPSSSISPLRLLP